MRVSLFIPCYVDQFFPQIGIATVQILRRAGCDVHYPTAQTCCGQPAFNTGYWPEARKLAENFCKNFADADAIVCPSGSCTAMVRNFYGELLGKSPEISEKTFEVCEFLVKKLNVIDLDASFPAKITYHDSCHALRELRCHDEPRQLLQKVRGLELAEMPENDSCCGFGGTFSVKFGEISAAMGDAKLANIEKTGAQYVVSADASCLMHIGGLLARKKSAVKPIHIAEILAKK
jgi:L-lactate dehydrogenase complex protein LldE